MKVSLDCPCDQCRDLQHRGYMVTLLVGIVFMSAAFLHGYEAIVDSRNNRAEAVLLEQKWAYQQLADFARRNP